MPLQKDIHVDIVAIYSEIIIQTIYKSIFLGLNKIIRME